MQNAEFTARLARINAGVGNTRYTLFVGMDEAFNVTEKALKQARMPVSAQKADEIVSITTLTMAFVTGIVAYGAALYLRFFVLGISAEGSYSDVVLVANGLCAVAIAVLIGQLLRLSGLSHLTAQSLGVIAALCLMHNIVHQAPEISDMLFSPQWTAQIVSSTEPLSLQFRDLSLTF
jgi:hypothetical protein